MNRAMNRIALHRRNSRLADAVWIVISFAVPVILLGIVIWYLYHSSTVDEAWLPVTQRYSDFNGTFFNGAIHETEDSVVIRRLLFYGNKFSRIDAIRLIVTGHLDIFFILATLIGVSNATIFKMFLFIRIGLAGVAANYLVHGRIHLSRGMALVLSTAYALSGPVLISSSNPVLLNLAIIFPLMLAAEDIFLRRQSIRNFALLSGCMALACCCSINGTLSGIILLIFGGLLISSTLASGKRMISYVKVLGAGAAGCLLALFAVMPQFIQAGGPVAFPALIENSEIRYKLFDFLGTLYDGRILATTSVNGIPQVWMTITVLFLYILFIINERIPSSLKIISMVGFLLLYLSLSWSVADGMMSIFGSSDAGIYSRVLVYAAVVLLCAAISLRNVTTLLRGDIYLAAGILLAVMFVHKALCGEVGPGLFSSVFSFASIIALCGMFIFMTEHPSHPLESVFASAIIIGFFINIVFVLGPSEISNSFMHEPVIENDENRSVVLLQENIPLFSDNLGNQFVILPADLSELSDSETIPSLINIASRLMGNWDILEQVNTFAIYSTGSTDLGAGLFLPSTSGIESQITIRAMGLDIDNYRYFAFSGFENAQTLSEIYGEDIVNSSYSGSFLKEIKPLTSDFNLKLAFITCEQETEFSVWRYNEREAAELAHQVMTFSDGRIILPADYQAENSGTGTIITSMNYDDKYIAVAGNGDRLTTYSVAGKLAIALTGAEKYTSVSIGVPVYDMITGLVFSVLTVCAITAVLIYSNKERKVVGQSGGKVDAEQENN